MDAFRKFKRFMDEPVSREYAVVGIVWGFCLGVVSILALAAFVSPTNP